MRYILDGTKYRKIETCNFNLLNQGTIHPDRIMPEFHDLLYIIQGGWTIAENGSIFHLAADDMIFLYASHHHYGISGCLPNTLTMFIHCSRLNTDQVVSPNAVLNKNSLSVIMNSVIHCQKNPQIKKLFNDIIYHYYSGLPQIEIKLSALLSQLFYELSLSCSEEAEKQIDDSLTNETIYRMRTSPHINYSLQELADKAFVSVSTLSGHFKNATGMTVHQYQLHMKLEMAKNLLANNENISLKSVASLYNFYDEFHFSKLFKKKYGISPTQFKKESCPPKLTPVSLSAEDV